MLKNASNSSFCCKTIAFCAQSEQKTTVILKQCQHSRNNLDLGSCAVFTATRRGKNSYVY